MGPVGPGHGGESVLAPVPVSFFNIPSVGLGKPPAPATPAPPDLSRTDAIDPMLVQVYRAYQANNGSAAGLAARFPTLSFKGDAVAVVVTVPFSFLQLPPGRVSGATLARQDFLGLTVSSNFFSTTYRGYLPIGKIPDFAVAASVVRPDTTLAGRP